MDAETLKLAAAVAAALGLATLGSWIVVRMRRQVKEFRPEDDPNDLLSPLHAAYIRGEVDEATYRRVLASTENRDRGLPGTSPTLPREGPAPGPAGDEAGGPVSPA